MEKKVEILSKLEAIYLQSKKELSKSDKYVIRIIWNRYRRLYIELRKGKIVSQEYAIRRRNYLNLIDDILGYYSIESQNINKRN